MNQQRASDTYHVTFQDALGMMGGHVRQDISPAIFLNTVVTSAEDPRCQLQGNFRMPVLVKVLQEETKLACFFSIVGVLTFKTQLASQPNVSPISETLKRLDSVAEPKPEVVRESDNDEVEDQEGEEDPVGDKEDRARALLDDLMREREAAGRHRDVLDLGQVKDSTFEVTVLRYWRKVLWLVTLIDTMGETDSKSSNSCWTDIATTLYTKIIPEPRNSKEMDLDGEPFSLSDIVNAITLTPLQSTIDNMWRKIGALKFGAVRVFVTPLDKASYHERILIRSSDWYEQSLIRRNAAIADMEEDDNRCRCDKPGVRYNFVDSRGDRPSGNSLTRTGLNFQHFEKCGVFIKDDKKIVKVGEGYWILRMLLNSKNYLHFNHLFDNDDILAKIALMCRHCKVVHNFVDKKSSSIYQH
ncbi:hypothetical protein HDU80_000617 [Chytriomyces hyalinus]|nr:hypothetical protein HDU80_000617 [Chytriomyces hyalinus]